MATPRVAVIEGNQIEGRSQSRRRFDDASNAQSMEKDTVTRVESALNLTMDGGLDCCWEVQ